MTTTQPLTESDLLVLCCVDRGGLHVYQSELAYQVKRRGQPTNELLDRLADLEAHGLIESAIAWRLTDLGREQLPDGHDSPPRGGTATPWTPVDRPRVSARPRMRRSPRTTAAEQKDTKS